MLHGLKKHLLKFLVRCELSALWASSSKFRYQRIPEGLLLFGGIGNSTRPCDDRLAIIRNNLPPAVKNVLDIGSNTGYYLFQLEKFGYICHGMESDPDLVHFSSLAAYLLDSNGVSCECAKLDMNFVDRIPCYDVVLCLSVMHHIIFAEGMDAAQNIMQGLARRTNRVMFFEMGQSNETEADWSCKLPKMEPDPETWISEWLRGSGFKLVKTIGTSNTTVPRFLFAAYP